MLNYISSKKVSTYILIITIPFLIGLGVDLYVPSLPKISEFYKCSVSSIQLSISLYILGYGIGQLFLGILSDIVGRKKILLLSAFFFSITSILCIISPTVFIINILRFLQGIFMAGLAVIARSIIVDVFSGLDLKKASNYFTLSWSLGPIIAPFIGATLSKHFGWQSNFYLFALYGALLFIYSMICFKESMKSLKQFNGSGIFIPIVKVVTNKSFVAISTISAIGYGAIVLFNTVGPFIIEKTLNYSITMYGYIAMFLGVAYFFGAILNRFLIVKNSSYKLLEIGISLIVVISSLFIVISLIFTLNIITIILPIFLLFFSIGLIVPNAIALSMNLFIDLAGTASSVFGIITGIVVFLITFLGTHINIQSSLYLAFSYFILTIVSLLLLNFIKTKGENHVYN